MSRIVLARPAVEAGEKLGFLPGDLQEKVNPYLRPLYDALYDMLDVEKADRFLERGVIEVAPLAFMRGRTLNDAFVILDEAQNTTSEQMKMFLTRLGFGSKAVVTGDVTQIDLPSGRTSGLIEAVSVCHGIEGIAFVYFDERDVVRHKLVQSIVKAYEEHDGRVAERKGRALAPPDARCAGGVGHRGRRRLEGAGRRGRSGPVAQSGGPGQSARQRRHCHRQRPPDAAPESPVSEERQADRRAVVSQRGEARAARSTDSGAILRLPPGLRLGRRAPKGTRWASSCGSWPYTGCYIFSDTITRWTKASWAG